MSWVTAVLVVAALHGGPPSPTPQTPPPPATKPAVAPLPTTPPAPADAKPQDGKPASSGTAAPVVPAAPAAPAPLPKVDALPEGQQQVLQALVIGVEGRSEWKKAGAEEKWKVAALDDLLDPGAEIRTGLRSTLSLRVGKNATLIIDRASRIELPVIIQDGAVLRTRAAVYRGKCDFKVEAVGITSDFQVLTPSATLAVRGTGFSVVWGALEGLEIRGVDTNLVRAVEVNYFATSRQVFLTGAGETSSQHPDPVERALFHTIFPPPFPDRRVADGRGDGHGDGRGDGRRPPLPPFLHDFHQQQQIDHGGSDLGRDTQTGIGTPGVPPDHG